MYVDCQFVRGAAKLAKADAARPGDGGADHRAGSEKPKKP